MCSRGGTTGREQLRTSSCVLKSHARLWALDQIGRGQAAVQRGWHSQSVNGEAFLQSFPPVVKSLVTASRRIAAGSHTFTDGWFWVVGWQGVERPLRIRILVRHRSTEPVFCLLEVGIHSVSIPVPEAEIVFRGCITVLGGFCHPFGRRGAALREAAPQFIEHTQLQRRLIIIVICGSTQVSHFVLVQLRDRCRCLAVGDLEMASFDGNSRRLL